MNFETETTTTLYVELTKACDAGRLNDARHIANEMCRPERAGSCTLAFPDVRDFPRLWQAYTPEQLQPLQDRIEQFNAYQDLTQ
jgi:hypothetical protein